MEKIELLYLDDEINNLQSFKAKFRNDFKIHIASNITEAYSILTENPTLSIIISDQRMPEMSGVDFFESILQCYPDPIRILLSGYSDMTDVINAINKGKVFRYLEKPWNENEIRMAVHNAYKFYFISRQLQLSNQELLKKNEELNLFAYSASHDLKSPVKSMLGILYLAKIENKIESNLLHLLEGSVKKLDYFINNIIDYYKNTRSEKILDEIDFNKLINDAVTTIETSHNTSTKDIDIKISIFQNVKFINDEFRLSVIISYLLSNALKYQKENESNKEIDITVTVTAKRALLVIKDNGIGIQAKYVDLIYNMFFRGTTQSKGSGIGLYIVKETVEKLNGTIDVNSIENKGTMFEISLPNELKASLL